MSFPFPFRVRFVFVMPQTHTSPVLIPRNLAHFEVWSAISSFPIQKSTRRRIEKENPAGSKQAQSLTEYYICSHELPLPCRVPVFVKPRDLCKYPFQSLAVADPK